MITTQTILQKDSDYQDSMMASSGSPELKTGPPPEDKRTSGKDYTAMLSRLSTALDVVVPGAADKIGMSEEELASCAQGADQPGHSSGHASDPDPSSVGVLRRRSCASRRQRAAPYLAPPSRRREQR
jgi:hypothetical protein